MTFYRSSFKTIGAVLAAGFLLFFPTAMAQVVLGAFSDNVQYGDQDILLGASQTEGDIDFSQEREISLSADGFQFVKGYNRYDRERYAVHFYSGTSRTSQKAVTSRDRRDQRAKTFGIGLSFHRLYPLYTLGGQASLIQQHVRTTVYAASARNGNSTTLLSQLHLEARRNLLLLWNLTLSPALSLDLPYTYQGDWSEPTSGGGAQHHSPQSQFMPFGTVSLGLTYLYKGDQWDIQPFVGFQLKSYLVERNPAFYKASFFAPLAALEKNLQSKAGRHSQNLSGGIKVFNGYNMSVELSYAKNKDPFYAGSDISLHFGMTF